MKVAIFTAKDTSLRLSHFAWISVAGV